MEGFLILALPWLFINTIIAIIVSNHASKNGRSGYFWIVFFLGIIGVLLYVADMAGGQQGTPKGQRTNRGRGNQPGNRGRRSIEEEASKHAVSAVYNELKSVGQAEPAYFIEHIYSVYPAGYESGMRWWRECIVPELKSFSDIEPPTDGGHTWTHTQAITREKTSSSDSWQTIPDTDFMHQELGERGRGLLVEVKDGGKEGGFFVRDGDVTPESYKLESEYGTTWVGKAKSYLRKVYL
ncbi:hypothetical protein ACOZ32_11870 [Halobacterium sp. MBLA0001]|uniref:hypothetical protein n=1 Tax=Halobacterium TaxID=2239 RepID=UPI0025544387|nr:hypothetical protein [Halobacterium salinarum]MDL0128407.1 hypothetical protein [Halobacterium salinarum]